MLERDVKSECLRWLSRYRPEILVLPYPSGVFHTPDAGRTVRVGVPGASDYILILKGGHAVFLEFKSTTGHLRRQQELFALAVAKVGADYVVARSLDDLKIALAKSP